MPDKKNSTVQIMRGIAIVAVLIWHSISQVKSDAFLKAVGQIIICFHMPVFFAIAGNLFEKRINKYINMGRVRFIKKKAKHLLIPYVFWTVLLWGCINLVELLFPSSVAKLSGLGYAPMDIKNLIWGLLTYEVYYTQHLWFVYVLFVLFVINILLLKTGRGILSFMAWLLLGFLTRFVTLPDIIERIMVWGCFFCFGRMIARRPQLTSKSIGGGYWTWISILLFAGISVVHLLTYALAGGVVIKLIAQGIKYAVGFQGIVTIYMISRSLKETKTLKVIGDYSFDIYLMHNPYIVALGSMVLNRICGINSYIAIVVAVSMGVLLPIVVSRFVISRIPFLPTLMLGSERKKENGLCRN